MKLRQIVRICLLAAPMAFCANSGFGASLGTAFTYQGRLDVDDGPANGYYDFTFTIYDALTGGSTVGNPLTQTAVGVTDGLFTTTLDFGNGIFSGDARWLEITVRTNNVGSYTALTPRQPLTPSPYAIFASGAGLANTMPWSGLTGVPVGNGLVLGGGNTFGADFGGNGAANTVSRSDHNHFGQTWTGAGPLGLALIDTTGSGTTLGLSGQVASPDGYGGLFKNPSVATFGGGGVLGLAGTGSANDVHPGAYWWGAGGEFAGPNGLIAAATPNAGGDGFGIIGMAPGDSGYAVGVYGWCTATNARNFGVYGQSDSLLGYGVYGVGGSSGVYGSANSLDGLGGVFENRLVSTFGGAGVRGMAASGSVDDIHPYGYWWGAGGEFAGPDGLIAAAVHNSLGVDGYGIIGMAPGTNGDARAVYGWASGTNGVNYGVYGQSDSFLGYGVYGTGGAGGAGIFGDNSAVGGSGVHGRGTHGVYGEGSANGVNGVGGAIGVNAYSDTGDAIIALSNSGNGVIAESQTGTALWAMCRGDFNHPQLHLDQWNMNDFCRVRFSVANGTDWDIATGPGATPPMNFYSGGANKMVLDYFGNVTATSFNPISDRTTKENFEPVSAVDILAKVAALPISCWNFKQDPTAKHIGPMAQDFYAAFGLGQDEKHIATVDADGVALAAIQGLNQQLQQQRTVLEARQAEIDDLKRRLGQLEQLVGPSKH